VFPNFICIHPVGAVSLCALMILLAALASLRRGWEADPLRAELRSPGCESAENFYY
jgi:hypothetical protein